METPPCSSARRVGQWPGGACAAPPAAGTTGRGVLWGNGRDAAMRRYGVNMARTDSVG
jgi:hypothetical protein